MLFEEEDILILNRMGLNKAQAKLYLSLVKTGTVDTQKLSRYAEVPRQTTYRTLGELQERGLIERIISIPQQFKAVPLDIGLRSLIDARTTEYNKMVADSDELLQKFRKRVKKRHEESPYEISIIEGRKAMMVKSKKAHENACHTVEWISTFQQWAQICHEIQETIETALSRGVKHRIILSQGKIIKPQFSTEMKILIIYKNFRVRGCRKPLKVNTVIFDRKIATFNFYPSKSISQSPMLWTNHPSILASFEDHFNHRWKVSQDITF